MPRPHGEARAMAEEQGEDIELEDFPDMSTYDYDLEYLLRKRSANVRVKLSLDMPLL